MAAAFFILHRCPLLSNKQSSMLTADALPVIVVILVCRICQFIHCVSPIVHLVIVNVNQMGTNTSQYPDLNMRGRI